MKKMFFVGLFTLLCVSSARADCLAGVPCKFSADARVSDNVIGWKLYKDNIFTNIAPSVSTNTTTGVVTVSFIVTFLASDIGTHALTVGATNSNPLEIKSDPLSVVVTTPPPPAPPTNLRQVAYP